MFDDKTEKSELAVWAAEFSCGKYVYENLPFLSNRKVFDALSYKQVQQFYVKIAKHCRELIKLSR